MRSKVKLFIDADSIITSRPSGIGSMTVHLIRGLSTTDAFTDRYKIVILTPFNKRGLIDQWKFHNVTIMSIPLTGRIISALVKFHLLPPVDIFLGKGIYLFPNFRNFPLLFSKSITYIHDVSFEVFPEFVEEKNLVFLKKNIKQWIKRADAVITVSRHAKAEIARFYPQAEAKTHLVYNGIDSSFMSMSSSDSKRIIDSYGLNYKDYFMFLSNIEPRKNISGLLAAYKEFIANPAYANMKLLMVGGMGWNNEAILKEIDKINQSTERIVIPSYYVPDSELPALLSGAAALLHPAHYEGFGISPLQAMACGTQVLVADNSSLPEVVGDAGTYVDSMSIDSIYEGMKKVYKQKNERNDKGIRRSKEFTWSQSVISLRKVIDRLS